MKKIIVVAIMASLFFVNSAIATETGCFAKSNGDAWVSIDIVESIATSNFAETFTKADPVRVLTHKTRWGLRGSRVAKILAIKNSNGYYVAPGMAKTWFTLGQYAQGKGVGKTDADDIKWAQLNGFEGFPGVVKKGNGNVELFCSNPLK